MRAHEFMPVLMMGVQEAGTIKPKALLDAEQWRRQSQRQAQAQQRIRDEDARRAAKERI